MGYSQESQVISEILFAFSLESIGKLMGKFVNRHEVSVTHDIMAGLTMEQREAVAYSMAIQEAHGIVDVEAYLVEDAG